jgi:hypothetical protein
MSIVAVGNTVKLAPSAGVAANVGNVSTRTTTFHVLNANASVYCYVGVFSDYATAAAMDYPGVGTDAGGIPLAPNESMTICGNFGQPSTQANIYVAAITATGTTSVFFTPVAAGSSAN